MLALITILGLVAAEAEATPDEAQDDAYETVVRGKQGGGIEAQRRLDETHPGFATAIDLDDEAGARSADALPEVLARAPGATVRSIGGLGQYSSVSLRGSSAQQVAIFLDGVPVSDTTAGLVSLSDFPLDTLGRIEVYRGHVPVQFGSAAIGGAINLVSEVYRGPTRAYASTGWGSFGAHDLRLGASLPLDDDTSLTARVGYAGAAGDFPFYDTNGTDDTHGDDQISIRENNDYRRLLGQLRLDGERGDWRYSLQQLTLVKGQGIPGPGDFQSRQTGLDTLSLKLLGSASRTVLGAGGRLAVVMGAGFDRLEFWDPLYEVGPGTDDEQTLGADLYLSPQLRLPLWPYAFLTAAVDLRYEHRSLESAVADNEYSGDATRERGTFGAGLQLEQFLFDNRLHLVPVVRIDVVDSHFAVPEGEGEVEDGGTDHVAWAVSPRAAARFTLVEGLQLRTSVGRYFRPPTVLELFGDRGYMVGNESLSPEQSTALDGGVVIDRRFGPLSCYLQAAGFAVWTEDLITWVPSATRIRPQNLDGAQLAGLETSLILKLLGQRLQLHANYTFLDSRNKTDDDELRDKPLPGRAEHELFARLSVGEGLHLAPLRLEGRLYYNLDVVSGTYLDLNRRYGLPPRVIHGLGAEVTLWPKTSHRLQVRLAVEVRNLTDTISTIWQPDVPSALPRESAFSDFIGYPLPGRSFWVNLSISGPTPEEEDSAT